MRGLVVAAASLAAAFVLSVVFASAQTVNPRVALVIGNSAYQGAPPLQTTIADAALITSTLQAAGYDVITANDVNGQDLGAAIGAFRDRLAAAGPNAVGFFYYAGYSAQSNADNYLIPVDAQIATLDGVANAGLPLSAVINVLAPLPAAARIMVIDAARDHGFGKAAGQPVPPGLTMMGVPPGELLAFSSAPNTVAPDGNGPNSPFASALATLMRQPGLTIEQILNGVRVQVNQASNGTQTPWMVSSLNVEVKLFDAPAAAAAPQTLAPALGVANIAVPPPTPRKITKSAMRRMPPDDAYRYAVEQDSLEGYQDFVEVNPGYQLAGAVWDLINGRREGVLWHRTLTLGTTPAYWNYLKRFPNGAHAWEARRWLDERALPPPPSDYVPVQEILPPGYYDEAVGLPDLVPRGFDAIPVFGGPAPIFFDPPRQRLQRPVQIIIQQPPAPPVQPVVAPVVTPKPNVAQTTTQARPVPLINAEDLRQQIIKRIDAQQAASTASAAAAEKQRLEKLQATLGPDTPPVLLHNKNESPWAKLLEEKEKQKAAGQPSKSATPAAGGAQTPEQKEKAAAIQQWQNNVTKKNEEFAKKWGHPAVKNAALPANSGASATSAVDADTAGANIRTPAIPGARPKGPAIPPAGTRAVSIAPAHPKGLAIPPAGGAVGTKNGPAIPPSNTRQPHQPAIAIAPAAHPTGPTIPSAGKQPLNRSGIAIAPAAHPNGPAIPPSNTHQPAIAIAPAAHPASPAIPSAGTQHLNRPGIAIAPATHPTGAATPQQQRGRPAIPSSASIQPVQPANRPPAQLQQGHPVPSSASVRPNQPVNHPPAQQQGRPAIPSSAAVQPPHPNAPAKPAHEEPYMSFQSHPVAKPAQPHPGEAPHQVTQQQQQQRSQQKLQQEQQQRQRLQQEQQQKQKQLQQQQQQRQVQQQQQQNQQRQRQQQEQQKQRLQQEQQQKMRLQQEQQQKQRSQQQQQKQRSQQQQQQQNQQRQRQQQGQQQRQRQMQQQQQRQRQQQQQQHPRGCPAGTRMMNGQCVR